MTRRILITLIAALSLSAEDAASIGGQITDQQGLPIVSADVRLRNIMTEQTEHMAADEKGTYQFPGVQPGRYSLLVEHPGYSPIWIRQIAVNSGEKSVQNVTMRHEAKRNVSQ